MQYKFWERKKCYNQPKCSYFNISLVQKHRVITKLATQRALGKSDTPRLQLPPFGPFPSRVAAAL
jgi:hypothetical protein